MQPAVEADLRAMRLSLERLAADEELPATAVQALAEVGRSLRRLERSWAGVLPYLMIENSAAAALLAELAPQLPESLASEITSLEELPPPPDPSALDATKANQLNGTLRDLLARALTSLPPDEAGARARARVRDHLRTSLKLRPW